MKTSLTALLVAGLATLPVAADDKKDDPTPSFKNRLSGEKEFMRKVGEAVVKAVRTSPAKLDLEDYKISDPKANRKVIDIKMTWAGSITKKKFKSEIKITLDPTDKDRWEVLDIDYSDDNPSLKIGMERNLKALREKLNR